MVFNDVYVQIEEYLYTTHLKSANTMTEMNICTPNSCTINTFKYKNKTIVLYVHFCLLLFSCND